MTDRKEANRLIATKIEGAKVREDSNEFSTTYVIDAGIPRVDYFSYYSSTPEGAWDELTIDYFTDTEACERAVDSAKLDWHFERDGDNFFFVFFDPDNAEVHPASGTTRAEAIATALYEFAKTL